MSAAAAAFVPTFISFDDDDDFGEFEFAAPPDSASPPNHARSNQLQWQKTAGDEDDDWGDFVDGPLQTQPFGSPAPAPPSASFFDPFPGPSGTAPDPATAHPVPPVSADKGWKKPSGALPLSLFGEEDEEDGGGEEVSNSLDPQISALKVATFTSFKTAGSNGVVASAQGGGLRDLIASLYGQTDSVGPASAGSNDGIGDNLKVHSSDGARSDFPNGADDEVDEFNENSWEFKDALDTPLEDAGDCVLVEKEDEFAGVPGAEVKVNDRGRGFQKCNDMLGPNLPTKVLSDEGEWGNAFVSHDTTISGFEAGSADNGCNGSSTNAHHDFENIIIENGLSLSMVSGDTSLGDSFWEFKDASSNTETMKHFAEPEMPTVAASVFRYSSALTMTIFLRSSPLPPLPLPLLLILFPPPHHNSSNQQQWQKPTIEEDDDWGDFVESSLQPQPISSTDLPSLSPPSSSSSNPFPGSPATVPGLAHTSPAPLVVPHGGWQKPSGALPLSLFGEEDKEDKVREDSSMVLDPQISTIKVESTISNSAGSPHVEDLKDLITSLYGQADKVDPDTSGDGIGSDDNLKLPCVNGLNSDIANGDPGKQDEFNKSCWEFKGALSSTHVENSSDYVLVQEGELAGVSGVAGKATHNFTGSQHPDDCTLKADGKKFDMFGSSPSSTVLNDGEGGNAFVSHDTVINGSDVRSVENGCNGSISNAHHNVEDANIDNRLSPNVISASGDTSLDDSFWEFKDASSNTKTLSYFTEPESIVHAGINELENLHTATCSNGNQNFGDSFPVTEGRQYEPNSIVNGSENVEPRSAVGLLNLVLNISNEPRNVSTYEQSTLRWQDLAVSNETLKEPERIVDFYSRLKQKSYTLALHHIENIKRANEEEVSGEEPKAGYLDGEIKAALSKLGIVATKSDYLEKSPNDLTVYELLEVLQTPCFQPFDMEYSLSAKIQLASKDLTSAMWLFEHASYILRILRLASYEEQRAYIISWSKLVAACEKELQHGAVIWSKAHHANIQKELLSESQGQQYFLALGEIYRVIEILSASVRLYKAWIFLNPADSSVFLTCIKKSLEAWKDSELKQALEIISESLGELKVVTKELLESLTYMSELSIETLQSHLPNHETHFCRLSLLPLELLPDIKPLVWQGDHYFSKLANLWANRISCDAPQLPHIHVGQ